jgi:hypothetical protein
MKVLGYRSADSMLKHESAASLFAAAWLTESELWAKKMVTGYSKLKLADFENKIVTIEHPNSARWQALSESSVAKRRHNILTFKELGTVVLLPLPKGEAQPEFPTLTTAVLSLHGINEILAASSFLKLHQMGANFGNVVREVVASDPKLSVNLLDQPVSWNLVQQYYARVSNLVKTDLFEPVIQAEDFMWHAVERVLERIDPTLGFWRNTAHLGLFHGGSTVSLNLTDNLLSHCNNLPFEKRTGHYFKQQLMTELLLRYLSHERLEATIVGLTHKQLATEPVAV